ncbi:hypothetical protein NQZ68_018697 [Dissostichus eleginoides]|nr:hypothetical protein NQZ68_018697 [Dissostichus eleginoides]
MHEDTYRNDCKVILIDEPMANGFQGPSSSMSSPSHLLIGSYSVDREVLKKLIIGVTLAAAILSYIVEKLYNSPNIWKEEVFLAPGQTQWPFLNVE